MLRTANREEFFGVPLGWRAENRMLGSFSSRRSSTRRASRPKCREPRVHEPYSPSWSLDGWTVIPFNPKMSPIFTPYFLDSAMRYRAADHYGITDERSTQRHQSPRRCAAPGAARSASVAAFEQRVLARWEPGAALRHARPSTGTRTMRISSTCCGATFRSIGRPGANVATLPATWIGLIRPARALPRAGIHYDVTALDEVNWLAFGRFGVDIYGAPPFDSIRTYRARAPDRLRTSRAGSSPAA